MTTENEPRAAKQGTGMGRKLAVLVAIIAIVAGFVLLKPPAPEKGAEQVLVLCGGSMRAPLEEIIERYKGVSDASVTASYGGSGELCAQIQSTGRGDIYVCHDPFMEWAEQQGLIDAWAQVGELEAVTIVPKGNPQNIQTLEDLARPGLRLGVGNQQYSTSGVIVKHLLEKLPFGEAIRTNIRSETKGHQQRCQDVAEGHLDVGIAWRPVAMLFPDQLDLIPIPEEHIDAISSATYGVSDLKNVKVTAGITATAKDRDEVRKFYEFVANECSDVWAKHGFTEAEG